MRSVSDFSVMMERVADRLIDGYGNTTVTLYDPTYEYDEDGDVTITLGTGSDLTVLLFDMSGEEMNFEREGIDMQHTYRIYVKASDSSSVDKESIFAYGGKYYKVYSIGKATSQSNDVYYSLVITKSELNI